MGKVPKPCLKEGEYYHKWTEEEDNLIAELMCLPTDVEIADRLQVSPYALYQRKHTLRKTGKLYKLIDKIRTERKGDNFIFKI